MKPNASTITSKHNLQGQQVQLGVDQDNLGYIMQTLTNLYSDPAMATLRELSTNARDAHIEAGNTRPIEVYTPSLFNPQLEIIDHGVGLSPDDLVEVFALYGSSTKRTDEAHEQTGALGLGCKSPLAYTSQFTMVAVKEGIRSQVIVSRDNTGSGHINIVEVVDTDEPNGVRITIPTSDSGDAFQRKAAHLFQFWGEGSVLVDDEEPTKIDGLWIDNNICLINDKYSYVVMGGVPYPIEPTNSWGPFSMMSSYNNTSHPLFHGVVVWTEMGSVDFTPSREELSYTTLTNETLARKKEEISQKAAQAASRDIDQEATHTDALKKAIQWRNSLRDIINSNQNSFTYRGHEVPEFNGNLLGNSSFDPRAGQGRQAYFRPAIRPSEREFNDGAYLIIYNYAKHNLNTHDRDKIRRYINSITSKYKIVYLSSHQTPSEWVSGLDCIDWDVVKEYREPKQSNNSQQTPTPSPNAYEYLDTTTQQYKQISQLPDPNSPIVYLSPTEKYFYDRKLIEQKHLLSRVFADWNVIILGKNRWDKFCRAYPNALHVSEAVHEQGKQIKNALSEADQAQCVKTSRFASVDCAQIEDPDLARFIYIVQQGGGSDLLRDKWRSYLSLCRELRIEAEDQVKLEISDPSENYPLLSNLIDGWSRANPESIYEYVNAVYRHRQGV